MANPKPLTSKDASEDVSENLGVVECLDAKTNALKEVNQAPLNLLVVDDDPADRALIRSMIDCKHYKILEAKTAAEGLSFASTNVIECALIDYNLPDMEGTAMFSLLRDSCDDPNLPIILFTGQGDEYIAVSALQQGASDYLPKNKLNKSSLARVLVNAVKQASLNRSLLHERQRILEMNRELTRANYEIGSFYQTVSHELKTPLMAIREFTSLTLDEIGGPITTQQREFLSTSLSCCDRLTSMINDLMDTARIETGKLSLDPKPCAINALVLNHITVLQLAANEANIALTTELAPELPSVDCDELRIGQVINNLVTNAIKFTPTGGEIIVSSWLEEDSCVAVSVKDTGRGIHPKFHSAILDRFSQTRTEDADFHKGMGIGLYLCANILKNHGSKIEVESELGNGSTFTFRLAL